MSRDNLPSLETLPEGLPEPKDDGAASHLRGMQIPSFNLASTGGSRVNLADLNGTSVIFCYPMTGVPGVALPAGWDDVPGARGCTPQACSYRDSYSELMKVADRVFGLSVQPTAYHQELKNRLGLPYEILSDESGLARAALRLPTFSIAGKTYLKRLTFITDGAAIEQVHYPVFPSNKDPDWVLAHLAKS